jgi:hypothetical protein
MNHKAGKLLVVESDDALRDHIVAVLSDAGYEVSNDYREGMKTVSPSTPTPLSWVLIRPSSIAVAFFPKSRVPSTLVTYAL